MTKRFLVSALLLVTVTATASAADWPQFLGPARNGISPETGLMKTWPAHGPKEVWRVKGGVGMSGMAISGGKLMTLVQKDGQQWLLALDAKTGKSLWETPLAPEYKNQMGNGPRSTPTIAGDQIFVYTGEGILIAASAKDGKILWQHHPVKELGGEPAEYGMACSPLVVGSQVIVTPGTAGAAVVAYDAKSGKLAWKAGDDPAGYSSPALLKVGGREQIVVFTGASAIGLTPGTGELLWRYPYETDFNCNIATPLAVDGRRPSSGNRKEPSRSSRMNGKPPSSLTATCSALITSAAPARSRTWPASTSREIRCGRRPASAKET
jgi:outer membrane protein assembly factor BamB